MFSIDFSSVSRRLSESTITKNTEIKNKFTKVCLALAVMYSTVKSAPWANIIIEQVVIKHDRKKKQIKSTSFPAIFLAMIRLRLISAPPYIRVREPLQFRSRHRRKSYP